MAGLYIRYLLRIIGGEGCTPGLYAAFIVSGMRGGLLSRIFCELCLLPGPLRLAIHRFMGGSTTRANMCAVRVGFPVSLQCCPRTQWGREFPQLGRIVGRVYSVLNVLYVFHVYIVYDV